jgi:hypothetical protein
METLSGDIRADLSEAKELLELGFKLVKLKDMSKQPVGNQWHRNPVDSIDQGATGYGVLLEKNELCSIDPDHWEMAKVGVTAWGFDLEEVMEAGARTAPDPTQVAGLFSLVKHSPISRG